MLDISICLLEKYFASTKITKSFTGSDGWAEKIPKLNQLKAPLKRVPKTKSIPKKARLETNKAKSRWPLFKKRQSMKLKAKNIPKAMASHKICLKKK